LALATARDLLGRVLVKQGRYDEAAQEMHSAVKLSSSLADRVWDNPECLDSQAMTNVSLGTVWRELGDYEGEAAAYERAVDDYRMLLKTLPGAPKFEENLALTLTDLGSLQYKLGRVGEAETVLREARSILQGLVGQHPQIAGYTAEGAYCQGTLARLIRDRGNRAEAKEMLEKAIGALQSVLQATRETPEYDVLKYVECRALCQAHLGQTLGLLGQHEDANGAFQAAVATLAGVKEKPPNCLGALALVHEHWGNRLHDAGQHEEAARVFGQAAGVWAALVASGTASADQRHNYSRFLTRCPATEFRDAKQAVEIAQQLTTARPGNATFWNTLGAALYRNGDWGPAVQALQRAQEKRPTGTEHGSDLFWLSMAQWQLNEQEAARAAYRHGVEWLEATLPHNPELRRLQREAADLLGSAAGR
jgi:tetratricopeptide (TPR) repeat protein